MKLALQMLPYNSSEYLSLLFDSLAQQTDRDWHLYLYDNSEDPAERERTKEFIKDTTLPVTYYEGTENIGFAGGHQKLFEMHDADYVQLINPDALLDSRYIETLRAALDANENLGAVSGAVHRWDWGQDESSVVYSDDVDTYGLKEYVHGKVEDIRSRTQGDGRVEVFGVSGCLPMYRRRAIEEAGGYMFDPSYGSYKEDVDLAYRLKRAGWKAATHFGAKAHHKRTFREDSKRSKLSEYVRYHSYKNHLWNLVSHMRVRDLAKRIWFILPYEVAKAVYTLFTSPSILARAWKDIWSNRKDLRSKRKTRYGKA